MNILAVSGSLRERSYNTALLKASIRLAPPGVHIRLAAPLSRLPFFNPDDNLRGITHQEVIEWRNAISEADAIIFACPEYAHNVPGVLKNALDWIVATGELANKPVAVYNASPTLSGPEHAHTILSSMATLLSADLVQEASLHLTSINQKIDRDGHITDRDTEMRLRESLQSLISTIHFHDQYQARQRNHVKMFSRNTILHQSAI